MAGFIIKTEELTDEQTKVLVELSVMQLSVVQAGMQSAIRSFVKDPKRLEPLINGSTLGLGDDDVILVAGAKAYALLGQLGHQLLAKHSEFAAANALQKAQG
jgi:hypothetical protein